MKRKRICIVGCGVESGCRTVKHKGGFQACFERVSAGHRRREEDSVADARTNSFIENPSLFGRRK